MAKVSSARGEPTHAAGSVGESLTDYADRTGQTWQKAYPAWHRAGDATARAWSKPGPERGNDEDGNPLPEHVTFRGGARALHPELMVGP